MNLGFGRSRFHFAGPIGRYSSLEDLEGLRIATSYVGVVEDYLFRHGVDATVTRLDGAVETSIQLGVADVIADVVETGSTLRAAGLETFGEVILDSQAVLITRGGEVPDDFEIFRRRIEGVLVARSFVMMDYDIEQSHLDAGDRAGARPRGPDHLPARQGRLGGGARDGAARRLAAADGRPLLDRCPRHPAHRHPCLPALTPGRAPRGPALPSLPHTWRPMGVRVRGHRLRR